MASEEMLREAYYYQSLENIHDDYITMVEQAGVLYSYFIDKSIGQKNTFESLKRVSNNANKRLRNLYDSV